MNFTSQKKKKKKKKKGEEEEEEEKLYSPEKQMLAHKPPRP